MDSLTQITLGAACGELVLGKKIGNRAMLWGAIGGTIPDLDVLANFMLTDIEALAFHRGISHSLLFAVTTPFLFAWLTQRFYKNGVYQKTWYKGIAFSIWTLLLLGILLLVNYIPIIITEQKSVIVGMISLPLFLLTVYKLWTNYLKTPLEPVTANYRDWVQLFFWSIFTHPLLDAFTAYGTQLFAPFSNYRVAFNSISVVDPIYTVPFIICLVIASYISRHKKNRRYMTYLGLALSSCYLLYTVFNKQRIDKIFAASLEEQNIEYQRFRTSPSIFNNILWQGVAEGKDVYYMGMYSLFDSSPRVQFYPLEKKHELIQDLESEQDIKTLKWFSDGYYAIMPLADGKFQLSDVRYGSVNEQATRPEDFVFRFIIDPKPDGIEVKEIRARDDVGGMFSTLITRIKGK